MEGGGGEGGGRGGGGSFFGTTLGCVCVCVLEGPWKGRKKEGPEAKDFWALVGWLAGWFGG